MGTEAGDDYWPFLYRLLLLALMEIINITGLFVLRRKLRSFIHEMLLVPETPRICPDSFVCVVRPVATASSVRLLNGVKDQKFRLRTVFDDLRRPFGRRPFRRQLYTAILPRSRGNNTSARPRPALCPLRYHQNLQVRLLPPPGPLFPPSLHRSPAFAPA